MMIEAMSTSMDDDKESKCVDHNLGASVVDVEKEDLR